MRVEVMEFALGCDISTVSLLLVNQLFQTCVYTVAQASRRVGEGCT
ncbi:hypothetical protein GXM_01542 [Nostoc sphaeroides CCNUC1]|uniref:Uncharacterized protein n=1 Tax=Nostoc sphaeroides CCNUC1 TaxID=2653204 RepID=A0A5P8VVZ4_9NOSO|nr:hypothetical protein GXM_01542 [Nostoc sphaeroides CCNUC1]